MGINQVGSVTDTVTGEDKSPRGLYVGLSAINAAISELQTSGMLNKAQKAEQVVLVMREVMHSMALELALLREEMDYIKRHGFGG